MRENNPNGYRKHKGPGKARRKICPNVVNGKECKQLSYNRTAYCPKCNYDFFKEKDVIYERKKSLKLNFYKIIDNIIYDIPYTCKYKKIYMYDFPYKPHKTIGFITPEYNKH